MCVLRTVAGTVALLGVMAASGQPFAAEIRQQPNFGLPVTPAPDVVSRPVELGTGWYLRGEIGLSDDSKTPLVAGFEPPEKTRPLLGIGFGYKQNNWMRYDVSLDYNRQQTSRRSAHNDVVCPYALVMVEDKTLNQKYGYLWDAAKDTCSVATAATLQKADLMGNFYIDLGTWSNITPYVGAGIGVSIMRTLGGLEVRRTVDGALYSADLAPTVDMNAPHVWVDSYGHAISSWVDANGITHVENPTVPFVKQNWSRLGRDFKLNPAFALMAGLSFDVTDQLKAELAWRYLNSGTVKSLSTSTVPEVVTSQVTSQQVTLGFRYMID